MLSSWVMQAGFEPPMVTVAVNRSRYIAEWLDAGAPFALNLVGENQKSLLKHFGHGFPPINPPSTASKSRAARRGVPVLAAALGYLECVPRPRRFGRPPHLSRRSPPRRADKRRSAHDPHPQIRPALLISRRGAKTQRVFFMKFIQFSFLRSLRLRADYSSRLSPMLPYALVHDFRNLLGPDGVLSSRADLLVYECDGYVVEKNSPDVVVFPRTTEHVAEIVRLCNRIRRSFPAARRRHEPRRRLPAGRRRRDDRPHAR